MTQIEMQKNCIHCNKQYIDITYNKIRKFCSIDCANRYNRYSAVKEIPCECFVCGKHFIGHHVNRIYCSDECKLQNQKKKEIQRNKKCEKCEKEFVDNSSKNNSKYCSKDCRIEANKRRKNRQYIKLCVICNEKFIDMHGNKKYCSAKCSERSRTIKKWVFEKKCVICNKKFKTRSAPVNHCDKCKTSIDNIYDQLEEENIEK